MCAPAPEQRNPCRRYSSADTVNPTQGRRSAGLMQPALVRSEEVGVEFANAFDLLGQLTLGHEVLWRLGQGADHGRMAGVAEAWDRSVTSRSTISSASVRLQPLRLACRGGARLIPILATRHGWARPGHACLWTDILIHFERGPPCQKKRSRRRNRKPN